MSRNKNDDMEWMLRDDVFQQIQLIFGPLEVDMFASKHNRRLPQYVSYAPDAQAIAVNAFSLTWTDFNSYLYPPFSLYCN